MIAMRGIAGTSFRHGEMSRPCATVHARNRAAGRRAENSAPKRLRSRGGQNAARQCAQTVSGGAVSAPLENLSRFSRVAQNGPADYWKAPGSRSVPLLTPRAAAQPQAVWKGPASPRLGMRPSAMDFSSATLHGCAPSDSAYSA